MVEDSGSWHLAGFPGGPGKLHFESENRAHRLRRADTSSIDQLSGNGAIGQCISGRQDAAVHGASRERAIWSSWKDFVDGLRKGRYSLNQNREMSAELESEALVGQEKSPLPDEVDREAISKLLAETLVRTLPSHTLARSFVTQR
jgi:hypothetical protein